MSVDYRHGKGALRKAVLPIIIFALMMLVACQGTDSATSAPGEILTAKPERATATKTAEAQRENKPGPTTPNSATPAPTGQEMTLDRIAYINSNGDLLTINPDGSDIKALTAGVQASTGSTGRAIAQPLNLDRFYAWPTWSPDGSQIAVSRVQAASGGSQISLEIVNTTTVRERTAYVNTAGGLVAQGAPHYIYWSPSSRYLSFLASTADGLTLFVKDTEADAEAVEVSVGAPLYWHWRQDDSALLLHNGTEIELAEAPFQQEPRKLISSPSPFRVPAISPDGARFAYINVDQEGSSLVVASLDSPENGIKLLGVGAISAFAWSPDGTEIAVADQQNTRTPVYQKLQVVSATDANQVRTITEEPVLSFFWSPQGDTFAWVGFDVENSSFEWTVADRSGDSVKRLFKFQPSNDIFTMLSFFDQYAYSNSPWSPDGAHLVVAGTPEGVTRSGNGQSPTRDRIYVLDATGEQPPLDIAGGTVAFWSWN
ncbi:MAG: hypothetical protein BZY81_03185 [SAR202 cluster bacterium Io17-Chloro-G4]|nr:MAG: hypothetical protein BZY81_03185 [SAR202 cluster bacterium Io17-Chloro-G4]